MKSIVRIKPVVLIGLDLCLVCFLQVCIAQSFFPNKANITPVKLFHINLWNTSSPARKDESVFGSKAKISRVVPLKHASNVLHANLKDSLNPNSKFENYSSTAKKHSSVGDIAITPSHLKLAKKNTTKPKIKVSTISPSAEIPSSEKTSTTTLSPKTSKLTSREPLFLTSDSWNYLNSAVTDDELRRIINGLSNTVIQNVTNITKHDPVSGQKFLLKSILSELGKLKRSRMLAFDGGSRNKVPLVNKGVRFSAKQRRPVLNVVPLEQKINLGKPIKNLIKTGVVEHWNISGLISNDGAKENQSPIDSVTMNVEKTSKQEKYPNNSITTFKASPPVYEVVTNPSLMKVLPVPDQSKFDSTTFTPYLPKQSKSDFVPISAVNSISISTDQSSIHGEKVISKENEISKEESSSEASSITARKPRVPPKEDEYSLPSITTTSTVTPEVNKGYQTITGSTTPGPKVVWYHHDQTPEDTFYPNSDNFLVPPEESSIEILADLLSVQHEDDASLNTKQSFFPASSEVNYKYDGKGKSKFSKKARPVLHYSSKEDDDTGSRSNRGSRFSNEKDKKKPNKSVSLQQAATTHHDGVREYYEDLDDKNGGSSEGMVYSQPKRKRYGSESYNSFNNGIKHEIIPRHQKTNRKPPPHTEDDTESYRPFNEVDHYHDSYPPRPVVSKHEISPYRYRSDQHDTPGENEYYKEEPIGIYDSSNGRYRGDDDGPPSVDSDAYFKKEPKYRLKESSPGHGSYHGHGHFQGYHGHHQGHNHGYGNHGHGWKDSKDFFAKAKDYFKNSDFSTAEKWFDVTIGVLAFLAFGGYIIMLLYQVFAVSSGSSIGTLLGRGMNGAGEMFDLFFSKGPMGQAYLDELETIVKRAMANVKRLWLTNSFGEKTTPKLMKGETDMK